MNKPLAAVILAAGKGTRMDSDLPKVVHKVGGKPMIVHVIHTAKALGAEKIIAVLGYKHEIVQKTLKNEQIEFALQLKQLGTAHAVLKCQNLLTNFQGNVLILYGDVPLIKVETLTLQLSALYTIDTLMTRPIFIILIITIIAMATLSIRKNKLEYA